MTSPAAPIDFLAELDAEVPGWENAEWDRAIWLLKTFIAVHGHARVPNRHVEDGFLLGRWVSKRRQNRKHGTLSDDRIAELDALGFIWDIDDIFWQRGTDVLRAYIAVNGHARVAQSHVEDGFKLGEWVKGQRQARKHGRLSDARIAELDALGFIWIARAGRDDLWQRGIDALRAYIAANGHARIPRDHVEDGFHLGAWVNRQRKAWKNGKMVPARVTELDALGFIWDASRGRSDAAPVIE